MFIVTFMIADIVTQAASARSGQECKHGQYRDDPD
jgi:hypothetical protein